MEVFKILAQDRIQRQRTWSRSLIFPARRGLPDFLPGQSSTTSSSSRLRDDADGGVSRGFSHFFQSGKSAKLGPHSGSELLPESSPSTRRAQVDAEGTPMVDDEDGNTWWHSCSGRWYLLGSNRTVWWDAPG